MNFDFFSAWFTAVQVFACFGLIFNMLCTIALITIAITRYRLSRRSMLVGCILGGSACKWTFRKKAKSCFSLFKGFVIFLPFLSLVFMRMQFMANGCQGQIIHSYPGRICLLLVQWLLHFSPVRLFFEKLCWLFWIDYFSWFCLIWNLFYNRRQKT